MRHLAFESSVGEPLRIGIKLTKSGSLDLLVLALNVSLDELLLTPVVASGSVKRPEAFPLRISFMVGDQTCMSHPSVV